MRFRAAGSSAVREFMANKLAHRSASSRSSCSSCCSRSSARSVYHSDQLNSNLLNTHRPPGIGFPLGTDVNGFDVLGRMMKGGQTALEIGFASALIATIIGTLWGAIAGLVGGVVDAVMMRIVDVGWPSRRCSSS